MAVFCNQLLFNEFDAGREVVEDPRGRFIVRSDSLVW